MPPEERLDMSRTKKQATEAAVREIRRRTRSQLMIERVIESGQGER